MSVHSEKIWKQIEFWACYIKHTSEQPDIKPPGLFRKEKALTLSRCPRKQFLPNFFLMGSENQKINWQDSGKSNLWSKKTLQRISSSETYGDNIAKHLSVIIQQLTATEMVSQRTESFPKKNMERKICFFLYNPKINHRMVWVGRDSNHLVPSPLPWPGTRSTRPGCSKPHLTWCCTLQGRGQSHLLWAICTTASPPSQ